MPVDLAALGEGSTLGPYEVVDRLGRGGMGVVYRARHSRGGALVALKTVAGCAPDAMGAIRREVQALARLRHPGIVRILAEGSHDGIPWYAMEVVDGETLGQHVLRHHPCAALDETEWWTKALSLATVAVPSATLALESAATNPVAGQATQAFHAPRVPVSPEALRALLTIVGKLCSALSYLHGEGIVHRDLKPGNVIVRPDGTPVIVDFGLWAGFAGASVSRDAAQVSGDVVGSIPYMAPEQVEGAFVDARADLYALGCILYELVARRPPFVGTVPGAIMAAHLAASPEPPSRWAEGLPSVLEGLILRLLAKAPRDRPGHADDVAAELARAGAVVPWDATAPPARPYLYRSAMRGRGEALAGGKGALADLASGRGSVLLVAGPSGSGKTRLASEMASLARSDGAEVLVAECGDGRPLGAFRPALQLVVDRARDGDGAAARVLAARGGILAPYSEGFRGQGDAADPQDGDPLRAGERFRLYGAVMDSVEALASRGRTLLLIDDLQWADTLSIGAITYLAHSVRLDRVGVLVLATCRSADASSLRAIPRVRTIDVAPLCARSVERIAADMLALPAAPEALARVLVSRCAGNPFLIGECLRASIASGALVRDPGGRWVLTGDAGAVRIDRLPSSVEALVASRLEGLSAEALAAARAASILGRDWDEELLRTTASIPDEAMGSVLGELGAREIFQPGWSHTGPRPSEPWSARPRFLHDEIREALASGLDDASRRSFHLRAAEALAARGPRDDDLAALARHLHGAQELPRARAAYLGAARHALGSGARSEAEQLYERHFALGAPTSPESVDARMELAFDILHPQGRHRESRDHLACALEDAASLGDGEREAEVLARLAIATRDLGEHAAARALFERALAHPAATVFATSRALSGLGTMLTSMGAYDEARACYERALALQREQADGKHAAVMLGNLGALASTTGDLPRSLALGREALSLLRDSGGLRLRGHVLANLGATSYSLGRMAEARELQEEAIAIFRNAGDRLQEGLALSNLSNLERGSGDLEKARDLAVQAVEIIGAMQMPYFLGKLCVNLAQIELDAGRPGAALEHGRQAISMAEQCGNDLIRGAALARMATAHRLRGEIEAAGASIAAALEALGEEPHPERTIAFCERAYVAMACGRSGAGDLALAQADLDGDSDREVKAAVEQLAADVRRAP